jgi:hypothetical protein
MDFLVTAFTGYCGRRFHPMVKMPHLDVVCGSWAWPHLRSYGPGGAVLAFLVSRTLRGEVAPQGPWNRFWTGLADDVNGGRSRGIAQQKSLGPSWRGESQGCDGFGGEESMIGASPRAGVSSLRRPLSAQSGTTRNDTGFEDVVRGPRTMRQRTCDPDFCTSEPTVFSRVRCEKALSRTLAKFTTDDVSWSYGMLGYPMVRKLNY